ncbi:hypothetical protein ACFTXM_20585 [Streptomyces sp. NPDC056930]|uniref:hypothetical protein n=1 Tax=Streptomyces sp. NPDC056930 TaxID=3345967 RepID=UPI003637663D
MTRMRNQAACLHWRSEADGKAAPGWCRARAHTDTVRALLDVGDVVGAFARLRRLVPHRAVRRTSALGDPAGAWAGPRPGRGRMRA